MIFSDLQLARRLEMQEAAGGASFVEARKRVSPESRSEWIEVAGAYAMFDSPDSPGTQTFGLGMYAELTEADLDRIEAFFKDRGAPVCHEVCPLAGLGVTQMLSRRGYQPIEFTSVMYQPLPASVSSAGASSDVRFETRLIREGEEGLWSQIAAQGWDKPELTDFLLDIGRVITHSEGSLAFFAMLDGAPVATGVLRCHKGVALFAGASTIPEARNRGAQRALLEARMKMAVSQGCDLAMMCAEPGGSSQRNAERQGFRIAYTRTKWRLD